MSDKLPKLDSLFEAALAIDSPQKRAAFIAQQCGGDETLRAQLEQMLASNAQLGSFLEKPPVGLELSFSTDNSSVQRAAALEAGLTSAFGPDRAVVLGNANHSVLKTLSHTMDIPRVSLRDAEGDAHSPVERPYPTEVTLNSVAGRYRVDGEIARGGMGAILKGRDTDLGRDLAIKVLLDEHKDRPEVIQRFIEEAQIGGQLQHPGIAPVYELGQFADQRPFFSMKLVKGQTLSNLLSKRKDSSEDRGRLIGIFEQVCQTLSYAHARGVIHRDLKPSNIMVGAFGEVQVMDWGLAKVLASGGVADEKKAQAVHQDVSVIETRRSLGSDLPDSKGSGNSETKMGSILGTPAYMPPEQALGEIDQLDQRADVFGLGAILCEILTGKPPYVAEDATAVFRMASRGKLDDAFARLEMCGADSELIVLAKECLAGQLNHRPQDAGVVAARLAHYLESVELRLRQTEQQRAAEAARVEEQRKRMRITTALTTAIGAVLLAGIAGTSWFALKAKDNFKLAEARANEEMAQRMRANEAEQLAQKRLVAETAATQRAEAAFKASQQSLFELNTSLGLTAADSNRPAEGLLWFAEAASHAETGSHQEQSSLIRHASWSESTPRLLHLIDSEHHTLQSMDYDHQGQYLAVLAESGQSIVWDISGPATPVFSNSNIVDQVWHPENPWLVMATTDGSVRVVKIPSGVILHEVQFDEPIAKLACDPRGQNVAFGGNSIQMWNFSDGSLSTIGTVESAAVQSLTFSQDGSLVLAAYDDNLARLFPTRSENQPPWEPISHQGTGFEGDPFLAPVFVNGGRRILTNPPRRKLLLTDLDTPLNSKEIQFDGVHITSITGGPNGKFVLTNQGGEYEIWDERGVEALITGSVGREVGASVFTPDGLDIIFMTKHGVHRRRVIDGAPYGSSVEHSVPLRDMRVSPNGRQVAIADKEGAIAIWEWGTYLPQYLHAETPSRTSVLNRRARQRLLSASGTRVKLSSSGDCFLVCGGNYIFGTMRRVTLRSAENGAVIDQIHSDSLVLDACIATDDQTLAFANLDYQIFVWKRGAPEGKRLLVTVDSEPMNIEFGPDERTLVVLQIDGTTTCFDTTSGKQVWQSRHPEVVVPPHSRQKNMHMYRGPNGFPIMQFQAYKMLSSTDRQYYATTCSNELVCVWNARDGRLKVPPIRFKEGNIERIAMSSDSRWLAIAGVTSAEVWDLSDSTLKQRFNISSRTEALVFDTTGKRLAICVETGECQIWDWQSHQFSCPPMRGTKGVFFGDGDRWFWTDRGPSGNDHFEAVLWSTLSGKPLTPSWAIPRPPGGFGGPSPTCSPNQKTWHFTAGSFNVSLLLDNLLDPIPSSIDRRRLEAEILAVRKIDRGKVITLTPGEWRERIGAMHSAHPEFFRSIWDDESLAAWHNDQRFRGLKDRNPHAAQWHLNKLYSLLGDQYEEKLSHEAEVHFFAALQLAQNDAIDEAAGRIRQIALEQAEWFLAFLNFGELRHYLNESVDLIDRLRSAKHDDEALLVFKLMQRIFAARFGRGDSRLRDIGNELCVDYWERGMRSRSIVYFEQSAPEEPSLEYSSQLILMQIADGQWQDVETQVRSILENTDPEHADAKTLKFVAQTAIVFPTRDVALAARITDFAERLIQVEPQSEGLDLLVALAQLRSGQIASAIENLRVISGEEESGNFRTIIANSGMATGLLLQGDLDAARGMFEKAKAGLRSHPEGTKLRRESLIAEAFLLEATRLLGETHSSTN